MGHFLIVGGAGYVGSHVVWTLRDAGHQVTVFDNFSAGHRELIGDTPVIEGSVNDARALQSAFAHASFDAVLHFAAHIEVGESVSEPLKYYRNNVAGMITLLEEMRRAQVASIVFSSTAAVYGQPRVVPIEETSPKQPINPYGRTKAVMEDVMEDCRNAYGLTWIALRYFNASGADPQGRCGEWHNPESHLIPNILMAAAGKRDAVRVFGTDYDTPDGTCIRDYIHVHDLALAHVRALELLQQGHSGPFNVGMGRGFSVQEVIAAAKKVTGTDFGVQYTDRRAGDPARLIAAVDRFRQVAGWKPSITDIDTIVRDAWQWHSRHGFGTDR